MEQLWHEPYLLAGNEFVQPLAEDAEQKEALPEEVGAISQQQEGELPNVPEEANGSYVSMKGATSHC
jgi:hypothetical protein